MIFYLRHLVSAIFEVLRRPGGSHRPFRVHLLRSFLRRTLEASTRHEPARIRGLERPTPLPPALRRRIELERIEIAGVDALRVSPLGVSSLDSPERGLLLYFHGGGYNYCSTKTHLGLISRLSAICGVRCVAPNYRLAPEDPFPAAIEDAVAVYRALVETEADLGRFWIGGDSAGGGLSLATLLKLREEGDELPRAAVLLSPWTDLTSSGESIAENAPNDYLTYDLLQFFARNYLGEESPTTPLASPLFADLDGLPPLLIQCGGAEVLLSEGRTLAERAREAGVDVTFQVWDDAIHAFQIFAPIIPEATAAIRAIREFLEERSSATLEPDEHLFTPEPSRARSGRLGR